MEKVTLKDARSEHKEVKGSMFSCIKHIYTDFTTGDGKLQFTPTLKKIMPTKKQALAEAQAIMDWAKVGTQKTIKRGTAEITFTIKSSSDMVLRYYVAKYNGTLTK